MPKCLIYLYTILTFVFFLFSSPFTRLRRFIARRRARRARELTPFREGDRPILRRGGSANLSLAEGEDEPGPDNDAAAADAAAGAPPQVKFSTFL
jgi:hypothetical protein